MIGLAHKYGPCWYRLIAGLLSDTGWQINDMLHCLYSVWPGPFATKLDFLTQSRRHAEPSSVMLCQNSVIFTCFTIG